MVDKNQEGSPPKSEGSQRHSRPLGPGFQHQEEKSPKLLAAKPMGSVAEGGKLLLESQAFLWKGPHKVLLRLTHPELQH